MPQYADLYFLQEHRSKATVLAFLDEVMPDREESAAAYVLESTGETFWGMDELLDQLEIDGRSDNAVYWQNRDSGSSVTHAMVFYTTDGAMILGISMPVQYSVPLPGEIKNRYARLYQWLEARAGCVTIEEPPPATVAGFEAFCDGRQYQLE